MDSATRRYLTDTAERVVATYIEAFAAGLIMGPTLNMSTVKAAALAGVVSAAAVLKAGAARFLGRKDSASLVDTI